MIRALHSLRVASQYLQPWLALIDSGTPSLDPKGRGDGVFGPRLEACPGARGSVLRSGEAAGYLEGIFVRKSGIGR